MAACGCYFSTFQACNFARFCFYVSVEGGKNSSISNKEQKEKFTRISNAHQILVFSFSFPK